MNGYSGFTCGNCGAQVTWELVGDHDPACRHAEPPEPDDPAAIEAEPDPDGWDSWIRALPPEGGDDES
jgi:hypothetical protein